MKKAALWAIIVTFVFLSAFRGLGSYPLIDPDESRYAQAAREMVEGGDWVVPHLDGEPRINKPPLYYWIAAAAYVVTGESTAGAARFGSAAAAILSAFFVYLLGKDLYNKTAGAIAVVVLFTMPLFVAVAHLSITDGLMTAFLTGAIYFWWRGRGAGGGAFWGSVSWAMVALSFLSKGPVAVVLYVIVVVGFCAVGRDWGLLRRSFGVRGILVFVALAAPWPVAVWARLEGAGWLWWRETVERFTSGVDHGGNVLFPLGVIGAGTLPWWCAAWRRMPRRAGELMKALVEDEGKRLVVMWMWGVIVFFSVSRTQLATYVLPATIPIAVAAGGVLSGYFTGRLRENGPIWRALVGSVVLGSGAFVYGYMSGEVAGWVSAAGVAVGCAFALGAWALMRAGRMRATAVVVVGCVAVGVSALSPIVMRTVAGGRSLKGLSESARSAIESADEVLFIGPIRHSMVFYSRGGKFRVSSTHEITGAFAGGARVAGIGRASLMREIMKAAGGDASRRQVFESEDGRNLVVANFDVGEGEAAPVVQDR